ncbi:MAG TPA: tetratricopeptide repeat protein [Pirellulales bacterium]|nr:tetratricopeptide repeat protein [Pirellulales bacterium]
MDTLLQVVGREPIAPRQLAADVPRDLETIALKCLQKEPARRYASAQAVADDLARFLADEPIAARPTSATYKLWRKAKRNRAVSSAALAVVVLAVAGLALAWHARRKAGEAAVASTSAEGMKQALERVRQATGIQQMAVLPFRNLAGDANAEWIGAAFATELESQLSGHAGLKVVGKGAIEDAAAALHLPVGAALDESQARQLGERLVVDHVVVGHFQQLGGQLQVSIKIVNTSTGAIDRGGMQVRDKFPDAVFDMQADLARQCLVQLGIGKPRAQEPQAAPAARSDEAPAIALVPPTSVSEPPSGPDAAPAMALAPPASVSEPLSEPEVASEPADSVEAWVLLGQGQHALVQADYDEAIRLLSQAVESDPRSWKAYRALGQAYQKASRTDDAVDAFRKALAINPDDLVSLVYFNLSTGRVSEGLDALERASKAGLADLDMLKLSVSFRFNALKLAGEPIDEKLITELRSAAKKHPKDEDLSILLALACAMGDKEQEATEVLREAAAANPTSYLPHLWLAATYEEEKRADDAEREQREAERLKPPGARGFRDFGTFYTQTGQIDKAEAELERARELEPDNGTIDLLLGQVYASRSISKAIEHFEAALAHAPKSALVLGALCRMTNLIGDNEKLTAYADRWTEADPDSYEAHQYLRMAYLKTGRLPEANAERERLAGLTPTHASFFFLTGNALLQGGQIDEAVSVLRRGHESFPDNRGIAGMFHLAEGHQLVGERRFEQAIKPLKQSQVELPSVIDATIQLVACYEATGRLDSAADQTKLVLAQFPQLFSNAAGIFKKTHRYDEAIDAGRRAVQTVPNDLQAGKLLVEFMILARRFDEVIAAFEALPATTEDQWLRRVRDGAWLADQLEAAGRFDRVEGKLEWVRNVVSRGRQAAAQKGESHERLFDVLDSWVAAPQAWIIAGPLPADSTVPSTIDPDATLAGRDGPVDWRVVGSRAGVYVDLAGLYPDVVGASAIAVSYVSSTAERSATLKVGSDDGVTIWLNDELVYEHRINRPYSPGADQVPVTFHEGQNTLAVRIDQGIGEWGFSLEPVDEQGWPVVVNWSTDPDPVLGEDRISVNTLFDRLLLKDDVAERLRGDPRLDAAVRDHALDLVEHLRESAERLAKASRQVALYADRGADEYRLALRQAEAACRLEPNNVDDLSTLAAAQYRLGRVADALATLESSETATLDQVGVEGPLRLAFRAMSLHRLDRDDEACRYLNRLRDLSYGESFQQQVGMPALLREAESTVSGVASDDAEAEAALRTVYGAEQAGWLHHDAEAYLALWADDAKITAGRGPKGDRYDRTIDRRTFERVQRLQFQGPPPQGVQFNYQTIAIEVDGNQARHDYVSVVQFAGGFESFAATTRLRKSERGWQTFENRWWPVKKRHGDRVTTFDAAGLEALDAIVEERRAEGNRRALVESLVDAFRSQEAKEAAHLLTESPGATAGDWALRGSTALRANDADDAIASFKRALELDGNAPVPPLRELNVPAPPTLRLDGTDLPPEREAETRSGAADEPAVLHIVNETPYTLELFWLDGRGKRVSYGWLHPRGSHQQSTYAKHFFLIADTAGRALGIVQPRPPERTVTLTAMDFTPRGDQ